MKIDGKGANQSRHYTPAHAAEELRKEMLRYSRDKESAACSALDFCVFLMSRLGHKQTARSMRKAKLEYLAVKKRRDPYAIGFQKEADDFIQEECLKAALLATSRVFAEMGYSGVAIVLENHCSEQFGELDEPSREAKAAEFKQKRKKPEVKVRGIN